VSAPAGGGFYGRDVAHVHETGHGAFARDAAPELVRRLHAAGIEAGLVVDLGCGSGVTARALLDAGFDVLGVDLSADLLEIGRRRAPEARFVQASLVDADLPPCVAVTAISEVVNYAADPRAGRPQLAALMRRAHDALRPGGLLLFDALAPEHEPAARRMWSEGEDWVVLSELTDDPAPRSRTRRVVVFRSAPGRTTWQRTEERHALRLYDRDETVADLRAAGFTAVEAVEAWGELRLRPGHIAYAATSEAAAAESS
jgi:SAM-dependent methyltransferase